MTRKRLLVVGGEPQVNDWLARAFATEFEILTAQTGVEAINKAVLQRPTCILVDAKMPRMGEHLLSKVFKMIEQTRSIPIVMVCENPDPEFRKMFQEMGVVACIEKPLSLEQVASVIDRALRTPSVERRRSPRVKAKIPVVIRVGDAEEHEAEIATELEDVSRLGALVSLPIRIDARERIEIRRPDMTPDDDAWLTTSARVVWSDEEESDGLYWHGLEFLNPSTQWIIRQYVQ
ncbi:MAG: response regulator [Acidobacteriia bacterium]|nr:response regulator [Terriglobia bacterium]